MPSDPVAVEILKEALRQSAPTAEALKRAAHRSRGGKASGAARRAKSATLVDTQRARNVPGPCPGLKPVYQIRELAIMTGWTRHKVTAFLERLQVPFDPPFDPAKRRGVLYVYLSDLELYAPRFARSLTRYEQEKARQTRGVAPTPIGPSTIVDQ